MKLASFDIFDTVLIRKCGMPENIFFLTAMRLYPDDRALREDFLQWRLSAEKMALLRNPEKDCSLVNIYADLDADGFFGYSPQDLMEAELQVERENLVANPDVLKIINEKRGEGYMICFISDMYLNAVFLMEVLGAQGCLQGDERVYVSCECNARKDSGGLYDLVRKELEPEEWLHYGDNKYSDYKIARKKGIKAQLVNTSFTPAEILQIQSTEDSRHSYETSILVGLERAARICGTPDVGANANADVIEHGFKHGECGRDFIEIAADFVAPVYIQYVHFFLEVARHRGLKRLYFLSRDGHILLKIAEVFAPLYPEIELRYLFVSRKSLSLPYLTKNFRERYLNIQQHRRTILGLSLSEVLKPFDIGRDELKDKYGITFGYDKIHSREQEKDCMAKLFSEDGNGKRFISDMHDRAVEKEDVLLEYFKQEGLFDGVPSGMVDIGWLGTSRHMINTILKDHGGKPVEFFYLGVRGDVLPSKYGVYTTFYNSKQLSTEFTSLIEHYFSASPYPSTMGYIKNGKRIVPIFKSGEEYAETEITKANVKTAQWIANEIVLLHIRLLSELFRDWAKPALDVVSQLKAKYPLRPMAIQGDFDGTSFVRKMGIYEIIRFTFLGDTVTSFDRASLRLSVGPSAASFLYRIHRLTSGLRRWLYLRTIDR